MVTSSAEDICIEIMKKVTSSNLDFKMNQTPYSLHFSIRNKFTRVSSQLSSPGTAQHPPLPAHHDDRLLEELTYARNEFVKLYHLYLAEKESKVKLEDEIASVLEKLSVKDEIESNLKTLKLENKIVTEKYEKKCLECKHQKSQFEDLVKEKNTLSVALKTSRKEKQEVTKNFERQILESESKILKLNDYREAKLVEEREARLQLRKELKKEKQKAKRDEKKRPDFHDRDTEEVKDKNKGLEDDLNKPFKEILSTNNDPVLDINSNLDLEDSPENDVEDEEFIGPRLPKMMTKIEKEAFMEEMRAVWRS